MTSSPLRLLGHPSSINVKKVLWLCAELELPVAHEPWGIGFQSTLPPDVEALNPNRLVPVIVDGDFVLWESNTICRYLAGREGRTELPPAEAKARARVEQWMDWQARAQWRMALRLQPRARRRARGRGVSTHRWIATPMERPSLPAVQAYYARLSERPAFVRHVRESTP